MSKRLASRFKIPYVNKDSQDLFYFTEPVKMLVLSERRIPEDLYDRFESKIKSAWNVKSFVYFNLYDIKRG